MDDVLLEQSFELLVFLLDDPESSHFAGVEPFLIAGFFLFDDILKHTVPHLDSLVLRLQFDISHSYLLELLLIAGLQDLALMRENFVLVLERGNQFLKL